MPWVIFFCILSLISLKKAEPFSLLDNCFPFRLHFNSVVVTLLTYLTFLANSHLYWRISFVHSEFVFTYWEYLQAGQHTVNTMKCTSIQ